MPWCLSRVFIFIIDIDDETFPKLQPHHIKDILPNMDERVAFEHKFKMLLQTETITSSKFTQPSTCDPETITLANDDIECFINNNFKINDVLSLNDQPTSHILPHIVVYQNLNVRTPDDIFAIQSIDLKTVIKRYQNNINSLENYDRVIIARAIIHHLLVNNLERT